MITTMVPIHNRNNIYNTYTVHAQRQQGAGTAYHIILICCLQQKQVQGKCTKVERMYTLSQKVFFYNRLYIVLSYVYDVMLCLRCCNAQSVLMTSYAGVGGPPEPDAGTGCGPQREADCCGEEARGVAPRLGGEVVVVILGYQNQKSN